MFILCFCSLHAIAEEEKKFAVETAEEVPEKVRNKFPQAQFKTPQEDRTEDVVLVHHRDKFIASLGIKEEHLPQLDEADKDILYWRLKNSSLEKLKGWYPQFPEQVWLKLGAEGRK